MVTLRDYQADLVSKIHQLQDAGVRSICAVSPTGAGKTVIASEVIRHARSQGKKVMFWAHRKELIDQCCSKLDWAGLREYGVFKGRRHPRYNPGRPIQVASVQTLIRRDHWKADLIIIDECHRSTAKSYVKLIERYEEPPQIIGLTATPYRDSGKPLGDIYEAIAEGPSVSYLVERGYLRNPVVYGAERVDVKGLKITAGDYNKSQLAEAMASTILRGDIVANWRMRSLAEVGSEDMCTVVFAVSVEQSKAIAHQFNEAGITARHIDGSMDDRTREAILKGLRKRQIKVVTNVGICTEGWDLPHLECVILARPTRSRSLYKQMVGRVMRPDPDKRCALVLDHADCTRMHGFVSDPEKYSLSKNEERTKRQLEKRKNKDCLKCGAIVSLFEQACPNCGYVFKRERVSEIGYTEEELKQLTPEQIAEVKKKDRADSTPVHKRQRYFNELCKTAMEKGYKPNWARMKFMNVFGAWPSWQNGIRVPSSFKDYEKSYKMRMVSEVEAKEGSQAAQQSLLETVNK